MPRRKVLGEAGSAINCKETIDAMAAKGYWKSPGRATPWATLYAAIIKEIATKGKESRFKKTDRGQFSLANPAFALAHEFSRRYDCEASCGAFY